jgi:integrase
MERTAQVENFLQSRESPKTQSSYERALTIFAKFCKSQSKDLNAVVGEWREARMANDRREEITFLEDWQDLIRAFHAQIKPKYASLTVALNLAVVKSFFKYCRIPVDVELPRRSFVSYHNRDLTKAQVRLIVSRSSARNRALWLTLAESGMRVGTAIAMRYWWIKDDFEAQRLPMRIILPSEFVKDHVGERWTFIGEDGFKALSEYLKPRMPLKDDDFVFSSERPAKTEAAHRKQFTVSNVSVIFRNIVDGLGLDKSTAPAGKPRHLRLHGLRKYFRNNCKADWSYREFWEGHMLGTDEHYVSRNPEDHYPLYAKAYNGLRVMEPSIAEMAQVKDDLRGKDEEIEKLKGELKTVKGQLTEILALLKESPLKSSGISIGKELPILEIKEEKFLQKLEEVKGTPDGERFHEKAERHRKEIEAMWAERDTVEKEKAARENR